MPIIQEEDQLTNSKTIYDVSKSEIFWRNVIAGAGRAVGGIIFQAIFLLIVVNLFLAYVWPVVEPLINTLNSTTQTLQDLQGQTRSGFGLFGN